MTWICLDGNEEEYNQSTLEDIISTVMSQSVAKDEEEEDENDELFSDITSQGVVVFIQLIAFFRCPVHYNGRAVSHPGRVAIPADVQQTAPPHLGDFSSQQDEQSLRLAGRVHVPGEQV